VERKREVVHFVAFRATPRASLLYFAATGLLFVIALTGAGSTWSAEANVVHIGAWAALALSPLCLIQLGWSYELVGGELLARRCGRERRRLRLRDYQGSRSFLGMLKLDFDTQSSWVVSGVGRTRQAFLVALHDQAQRAGAWQTAPPRVQQLDAERVRVPLAALHMPVRCVACGGDPASLKTLRVQRGFDALVWAFIDRVELSVPVCAQHARGHARWRAASALGFVPLAFGSAALIKLLSPTAAWSGASIAGLLIGLALYKPLYRMVVRPTTDWLSLGMRGCALSADLTLATLRVRNAEMLLAILAASRERTCLAIDRQNAGSAA
jgi:hypothetical protein